MKVIPAQLMNLPAEATCLLALQSLKIVLKPHLNWVFAFPQQNLNRLSATGNPAEPKRRKMNYKKHLHQGVGGTTFTNGNHLDRID